MSTGQGRLDHDITSESNKRLFTMALRVAPSASFLHAFLPIARNTLFGPTVRRPLLERCRESLLPAIVIPIPSLVSDIWESVLRAVPKKKTSHMKKRHRQMAGKALKDVTALNTCSGCGRTKRAHILCPHCVASKLGSSPIAMYSAN